MSSNVTASVKKSSSSSSSRFLDLRRWTRNGSSASPRTAIQRVPCPKNLKRTKKATKKNGGSGSDVRIRVEHMNSPIHHSRSSRSDHKMALQFSSSKELLRNVNKTCFLTSFFQGVKEVRKEVWQRSKVKKVGVRGRTTQTHRKIRTRKRARKAQILSRISVVVAGGRRRETGSGVSAWKVSGSELGTTVPNGEQNKEKKTWLAFGFGF